MKKAHTIVLTLTAAVQLLFAVDPNHPYEDRRAPSQEPPIENPPMLIVLGADDNFNLEGMEWMLQTLADRKHSDGSNLRMSFYCNSRWSWMPNKDELMQTFKTAYLMGNEVTSHTATHIKCSAPVGDPTRYSDDTIYAEIQSNIDDLAELGIKKEHMIGFRTPYLAITDSTFIAVQRAGFTYDCSIVSWSQYKPGKYNWPYTLDTKNSMLLNNDGLELPPLWWDTTTSGPRPEPIEPSYAPGNHLSVAYNNYTNRAPIRKHSGLWELPLYQVYCHDSLISKLDKGMGYTTGGAASLGLEDLVMGDTTNGPDKTVKGPAFTKEEALETLKHHFNLVYNGNRSPMTLLLHTPNFSPTTGNDHNYQSCSDAKDRQWFVEQFIDFALTKEDVWFVSGEQAINFCRQPVSADEFDPNAFSAIPVEVTSIVSKKPREASMFKSYLHSISSENLSLTIHEAGEYSIKILSLNGRELRSFKKYLSTGSHILKMDKALVNSMVVCQISFDGKSKFEKVVIK